MGTLSVQFYSVIYALVYGLIGLLVWKCFSFIRGFLVLKQKLSPVPSLPRHWLLGNARKGQIEDSHSFVDIVAKQANAGKKLLCTWVGPFPVVSILHPHTFRELIKQTREKAKNVTEGADSFVAWIGDGLLFSEGSKWKRNRTLLTPAFHFDILNGYIQTMNNSSNVLLDKLAAETSNGQTIDVFPHICRTTLDVMLKCSLSYEGNVQDDSSETEREYVKAINRISVIVWKRATQPLLGIKPIFYMLPLGQEFYALCDKVHAFTRNIIQKRVESLKEQGASDSSGKKRRLDFLDILLTAKDAEGNGLSPQEIQDEVDTFTFEGHDTTASGISWAIYALGKYPELQQKVYQEVCEVLADGNTVTKDHLGKFTYLSMFVKEVLRFYSPVPIITRANYGTPVTLDGIEIPAGVSFWTNIYAIHHNEEIWPNNMVFDPERFSANNRDDTEVFGFIPFSAGARNCIGQAFAMNEIKINVSKIVKRFEVSVDATKEPVLLPDIVMRAKEGINICLKERN